MGPREYFVSKEIDLILWIPLRGPYSIYQLYPLDHLLPRKIMDTILSVSIFCIQRYEDFIL